MGAIVTETRTLRNNPDKILVLQPWLLFFEESSTAVISLNEKGAHHHDTQKQAEIPPARGRGESITAQGMSYKVFLKLQVYARRSRQASCRGNVVLL